MIYGIRIQVRLPTTPQFVRVWWDRDQQDWIEPCDVPTLYQDLGEAQRILDRCDPKWEAEIVTITLNWRNVHGASER